MKGNVCKDAEMKYTPNGTAVSKFSMATNEFSKDKEGNKKQLTEFHNIVVWGKRAESLSQYILKGSAILIEGKLQTRSWEKDGATHYSTEVVASDIQLLGGRESRQPGGDG